jgi:ribonuclease E
VGKINRFGVLVMTRQRIRPSLQHVNHETCPTCTGTGKVKTMEALVLSVVRRLQGIISKGGIGEIRVKLAPSIAAAVLNQKRRDLSLMEDESEAKILILADWSMGYGEMAAEIERAEEAPVEKPALKPHREKGAPEDETVVLGGDSPISFDKALGIHGEGPKEAKPEAFKYDRRDLQRAALDERERLRALFESAKPEDDETEDGPEEPGDESKGDGAKRKRRRRRRKPGADRGPETTSQAAPSENLPGPASQPEPQPEPPRATPDLVASLLTPSPRPRIGGPAPVAAVIPPQLPKPKRTPRAKVTSVPETLLVSTPAPLPEPAPEPIAPAKKRPAPKSKVSKAASDKDKDKAPKSLKAAPGPKATRAKKAKAE